MSIADIVLIPMPERLRRAAEVLERIGVEPLIIQLRPNDVVAIDEETFRKMFSGESFAGKRDGGSHWIKVTCCRHGLIWETRLYSPPSPNDFVSLTA